MAPRGVGDGAEGPSEVGAQLGSSQEQRGRVGLAQDGSIQHGERPIGFSGLDVESDQCVEYTHVGRDPGSSRHQMASNLGP